MTKKAVLKEEMVEKGYIKFTMTYSTGGEFVKYLSPGDINQDHDLREEMVSWAKERGFSVFDA